jgi:uncharacterized protein YcfL
MKRIVAPILLATLIAGCTDSIPAYHDPNAPLQVSMSAYWLQWYLRVTVPKPERVGDGQLKVTLQLFNATDSDLLVQYKYYFVDKSGTQVDQSDTNWEMERIAPKGTQQITFTSLSAAAEDFRVEFRPAK